MTIAPKTVRSIAGFIVIMVILFQGQAITKIIEAHNWVGVILLICAASFTLWGMFWRKEDKV